MIKETICEESVSAELSTKEIALCQKEAKKVLELVIAEEEKAREEAVGLFCYKRTMFRKTYR